MWLDEQIVAIERGFAEAAIPHAFGGAHALGYYGGIRATHDIDINVFLPAVEAERVLGVLGELGATVSDPALRPRIARDEQVRIRWETTPLDLFFAYDPLHESSAQRRRKVDFGGDPIHILSPEDLITYKAIFDRDKDWHDIAAILFAYSEPLDLDYIRGWLTRVEGPDGEKRARLERVIASEGRSAGDG